MHEEKGEEGMDINIPDGMVIYTDPISISKRLMEMASDLSSRNCGMKEAEHFADVYKLELSHSDYALLSAAIYCCDMAFDCVVGNDDLWFGESFITYADILEGWLKFCNIYYE